MLTKDEMEFLKRNLSSGTVQEGELGNDEPIPFVAVPNMRKHDGSLRSFSLDEILEALNAQPARNWRTRGNENCEP